MTRRRRDEPWPGAGSRRWALLVCLLLLVVSAAGCSVNTRIDVVTTPKGTGTVEVTVTLDSATTRAIGDLASELQTTDLAEAGWEVTGPVAGPESSTIIKATHPFASLSQASTLVAEIAGTGPDGHRPFQLQVTHRKTFWTTSTELRGRADLRCNLDCFGDSGLQRALGTSTGVAPGSVASQQRDFTFGMSVTLPGTLKSSNAESVVGHRLTWVPRLGTDTVLSATTSDRNMTHVIGVAVAGGVVVLAIIVTIVILLWRRHSRRRRRYLHMIGQG